MQEWRVVVTACWLSPCELKACFQAACFPKPACVGIGTDSCTACCQKSRVFLPEVLRPFGWLGSPRFPPRFVVSEPKPTIDDAPQLSFFNQSLRHLP